jgi:hypothetical protein
MDPKSRPFKSPEVTVPQPEWGAELVARIAKDMERAKREREQRAAAEPRPPEPRRR